MRLSSSTRCRYSAADHDMWTLVRPHPGQYMPAARKWPSTNSSAPMAACLHTNAANKSRKMADSERIVDTVLTRIRRTQEDCSHPMKFNTQPCLLTLTEPGPDLVEL